MRFAAFATVHVPLFGMPAGDDGAFGLGLVVLEAQHLSVERLTKTLARAFDECSRAFIDFRISPDAPAPCMVTALASALKNDLAPLALEQTTVACASEEAARVAREIVEKRLGAAGSSSTAAKGADAAKVAALERAIADMRREMATIHSARGSPPPRGEGARARSLRDT